MSRGLRSVRLLTTAWLLGAGALFARSSETAPLLDAGADAGVDAAGAAVRLAVEPSGDAGRALDLGDELQLAGDLDAAGAAYRQAIALDPGSPTAHYKLGRLTFERGHRFAARRELLRALELDSSHAEAHYFLGAVHDRLGFERAARKSYRRAFELAPELADPIRHPEVSRNRQALATLVLLWQGEGRAPVDAQATSPVAAAATRTDPSGEGAEPSSSVKRPQPGRSAKSGDLVVDPSDLRSGGSVNQLVAPGSRSREGSRPPTGGSRGFGPRLTPPPNPPESEEDPNEQEEDSNEPEEPPPGPSGPRAFAISG